MQINVHLMLYDQIPIGVTPGCDLLQILEDDEVVGHTHKRKNMVLMKTTIKNFIMINTVPP